MDLLEKLLDAGDKIKERPTGEIEVTRLSKIIDEPFIVKMQALTAREFDSVVRDDPNREAEVIFKSAVSPDFKGESFRKALTPEGRKTPYTPVEAISKLFMAGEISKLSDFAMGLSGFGRETTKTIEEIKKN